RRWVSSSFARPFASSGFDGASRVFDGNGAASAAGDAGAAPGTGAGLTRTGPAGVSAETAAAAAAGDPSAVVDGLANAGGGASNVFFCGSGARYGSTWRGRAVVTPAEFRGRICGVIITTSSV